MITYSLEAYWRKGPYLVGFEYLGADVDSAESGDPFFHGFHLSGSWAVTGEMRTYRKRSGIFNPLPVAKPVHQGGWGTLETAFRYSRLDLTDGTVDGGEMDIYSLGLNWWLTRSGPARHQGRQLGSEPAARADVGLRLKEQLLRPARGLYRKDLEAG